MQVCVCVCMYVKHLLSFVSFVLLISEIIPSFTMAPFDCGDGFFRCADVWHEEVRCFPKSYLCDGKPDCIDGKDEENCGKY